MVAYNPTNKTADGTYRAIKVTVDQPSNSINESRLPERAVWREGRSKRAATTLRANKKPAAQ